MKNYNKTNSSKYADISVFDFDGILSDKDYRHSLRISKKEQKIAERQKNKKVQEIVQKSGLVQKQDIPMTPSPEASNKTWNK